MQYHMYWTPQTQLHQLQGATVDFKSVNDVYYEHYFLPSGQIIATWHSQQYYVGEKRISDLPRLLKGQTYTIARHIDNSERMFAYLVVTFFDKDHQPLLTNSQNSDEVTITVPNEYAFYTIDLVSAGNGSFVFHDFVIRPHKKGILRDDDETLAPRLYSYLQQPKKIMTKTLRVIFSEPERYVTDYMSDWVKLTHQAVQYIASSEFDAGFCRANENAIMTAIKKARKQAHAHQVEFIGYGPISSYAALYYQSQFKGGLAVISEDVDLAPTPTLAITRSVEGVNYLRNPMMPNDTIKLLIKQPQAERLATLDYDTPTPEELQRQNELKAMQSKNKPLRNFFKKDSHN